MRRWSLVVLSAGVASTVGFLVWLIDTWQRILGRVK